MASLDRYKNSLHLAKFARFLLAILLFLSLTFPTTFTPIKIGILAILGLIILVSPRICSTTLSFNLYFFSCVLAVIGLIWSIFGEILGNPGALGMINVMFFYPIILPILSLLYKKGDEISLYKIFFTGAWFIALNNVFYVLLSLIDPNNIIHIFYHSLYKEWAVVDISDNYIKFTLPNVSSLIFLLPFFLSNLIFNNDNNKKNNFILILLLILLFSVALLAGRRAIFLTVLLGPLLAIFLTHNKGIYKVNSIFKRKFYKIFFIFIVFLIAIFGIVMAIGLDYFIAVFRSIFDFKEDPSNLERVYQFNSLLKGIYDSPVFGHGAGAVADYVRDEDMPWAYELMYLAILFQYGIIAFIFYLIGIALIIWKLIFIIREKGRNSFEFYFLSGFIAFLISSSTNPYLLKFDYMWIIFIPYALINRRLTSKNCSFY